MFETKSRKPKTVAFFRHHKRIFFVFSIVCIPKLSTNNNIFPPWFVPKFYLSFDSLTLLSQGNNYCWSQLPTLVFNLYGTVEVAFVTIKCFDFRVMKAMHENGVPVPKPIVLCEDER